MTVYEREIKNRKQALADFLKVGVEMIGYDEDQDTYLYEDQKYMILDDNEADEEVEEEIKNSLLILQTMMSENHQPVIEGLIEDMKIFVKDAIREYGRGHFLANYDLEEAYMDTYYIYRLNWF